MMTGRQNGHPDKHQYSGSDTQHRALSALLSAGSVTASGAAGRMWKGGGVQEVSSVLAFEQSVIQPGKHNDSPW